MTVHQSLTKGSGYYITKLRIIEDNKRQYAHPHANNVLEKGGGL